MCVYNVYTMNQTNQVNELRQQGFTIREAIAKVEADKVEDALEIQGELEIRE